VQLEHQLTEDMARAEEAQLKYSQKLGGQLMDLKGDFSALSAFYGDSVKGANYVMKAKRWVSSVHDSVKSLSDEVGESQTSLTITDLLTPPAWLFKSSKDQSNMNLNVLGQQFNMTFDEGRMTVNSDIRMSFDVTICGEGKIEIFHMGPTASKVTAEVPATGEVKLVIRPSTFKDAFEALYASSCEEY